MKSFLILAKHDEDSDGCLIHEGSFIPTLLVEAASAEEAMQRYYDEADPITDINYTVHTIEITDTDEFRFEITLEQKVKTD